MFLLFILEFLFELFQNFVIKFILPFLFVFIILFLLLFLNIKFRSDLVLIFFVQVSYILLLLFPILEVARHAHVRLLLLPELDFFLVA